MQAIAICLIMVAQHRPGKINLLEHLNYKEFILTVVAGTPKPRGQFRKIAEAMRVHTSMVSQVLRGNLDLTLEQGLLLTEYFKLGKKETNYFLLLILYSRAGSVKLKSHFLSKIQAEQRRCSPARTSEAHIPSVTITEIGLALRNE